MSGENSSSARILMNTSGEVFKVAGLAISSVSILYVLRYTTAASCAVVEYLPYIFNPKEDVTLSSHMHSVCNASWMAVASTCVTLAGGVFIRKIGGLVSDEKSIATVERFLYGKKN